MDDEDDSAPAKEPAPTRAWRWLEESLGIVIVGVLVIAVVAAFLLFTGVSL